MKYSCETKSGRLSFRCRETRYSLEDVLQIIEITAFSENNCGLTGENEITTDDVVAATVSVSMDVETSTQFVRLFCGKIILN